MWFARRLRLKWQGYRKHPEVKKLSEALFIIAEDEDRLFWKLSPQYKKLINWTQNFERPRFGRR